MSEIFKWDSQTAQQQTTTRRLMLGGGGGEEFSLVGWVKTVREMHKII